MSGKNSCEVIHQFIIPSIVEGLTQCWPGLYFWALLWSKFWFKLLIVSPIQFQIPRTDFCCHGWICFCLILILRLISRLLFIFSSEPTNLLPTYGRPSSTDDSNTRLPISMIPKLHFFLSFALDSKCPETLKCFCLFFWLGKFSCPDNG